MPPDRLIEITRSGAGNVLVLRRRLRRAERLALFAVASVHVACVGSLVVLRPGGAAWASALALSLTSTILVVRVLRGRKIVPQAETIQVGNRVVPRRAVTGLRVARVRVRYAGSIRAVELALRDGGAIFLVGSSVPGDAESAAAQLADALGVKVVEGDRVE
jgi:hypothetical protein